MGGNCEICNSFSYRMITFELTSYENQNIGFTNDKPLNPKHRSISVCDRCYQELHKLRFGYLLNKSTNF